MIEAPCEMWHMDDDLLDVDFEEMTCDKGKPKRYREQNFLDVINVN